MKKKIAFFTKNLDIGGIERAIINYVNNIDKEKYEVYLFLDKAEGIYLDQVSKEVKIINLNISNHKNPLIRKIKNAYKLFYYSLKYYHKFYFAASFATYLKSGSILSKRVSQNNAIWFHGNYWSNSEEANAFIKRYQIEKFKKIVFVSNNSKNLYVKERPDNNQLLYVVNNMINYEEMLEKSKIDLKLKKNKTTILNVGRHEESSKKLSLLLKASKKLLDEGYDFNLWMVGDGIDHEMYVKMVKDLKLEKNVIFFGKQSNVYPYFIKSDAVILSSKMEGNPVVYLEAKVLNRPIISTDIADAKIELDGYGIVTKYSEDGVYKGLKEFLDKGYSIKKKFNPKEYNQDKLDKLYHIIED